MLATQDDERDRSHREMKQLEESRVVICSRPTCRMDELFTAGDHGDAGGKSG